MARFGKYELLSKIGEGGMAEVHLARAAGAFGTEKLLVLKRLLPELAATERYVRMFLDEARLALRLNHANIVQVYEADESDGVAFYVMELLHGRDLREVIREAKRQRGRVPLEHAIAIVLSTCAALQYAHDVLGPDGRPLGIVHRDVSPHNVFVLYDGVVKVIDFGIAKLAVGTERTATGMLKGKVGYMSPEQCLQQPLDRRSDVFCVGVLLWELTTGQRLFKAPSEYQVVKAIVETNATPPRRVDPEYPPDLERIVMKALKRDRSARHATARELEADLQAFARTAGLDLSPASLAGYMERLFEKDADSRWRALIAGRPLPDVASRPAEPSSEAGGTPPSSAASVAVRTLSGETRSAAVTETIVPQRHGRARPAVAAAVAALAVVGVVVVTLLAGDRPQDPVALLASDPAPPDPEPAPSVTSTAAPVPASATASAPPTASAVASSRRRPSPPITARPKAPPRAPPAKTSPPRDPDAPLPR